LLVEQLGGFVHLKGRLIMKYTKKLINGFESIEITAYEDGVVTIEQGDNSVTIPSFMLDLVVAEVKAASAQVAIDSDGE
jgi:hypothetical protein